MRKLVLLFSSAVCMALFFSRVSFCEDYSSSSGSSQQESVSATESTDIQSEGGYSEPSKVLLPEKISPENKFKEKSFIGSKKWKGDGNIVGDKDNKGSITAGDTIYTSLGSYEVKEGTRCDIFRRTTKIKDQKTGKSLGYEIRHIGVVEIIGNVGVDSSAARVVSSREPIMVGDELKIIETEK